MGLTREQLEAMQLPDEMIEQLMKAHMEDVSELQQQIDSLSGKRKELEQTLSEERRGWELKERERVGHEAIHAALRRRGVNEQVLTLLTSTVRPESITMTDGVPDNAEALAEQLAQQYPGLFAQPETIAGAHISPPLGRGRSGYTAQDIDAMSTEEINRNWSAVKEALTKGE